MKTLTLILFGLLLATNAYAESNAQAEASLPSIIKSDEARERIQTGVKSMLAFKKIKGPERARIEQTLVQYLEFLGLGEGDEGFKQLKKVLGRVSESSMAFLFCSSYEDFECLESSNVLSPNDSFRKDTAPDLGRPVSAGSSLDVTWAFTKRWDAKMPGVLDRPRTVAPLLASKIRKDGTDSLWFAIYGIDDGDGSMKPVLDALTEAKQGGIKLKGVTDSSFTEQSRRVNLNKVLKLPKPPGGSEMKTLFDFSMVESERNPSKPWILDSRYNMLFQYKDTPRMMRMFNEGITSGANAIAKLENKDNGIMHNKVLVMKNKSDEYHIWTGTANISKACMGDEDNTNLAVYIKNETIAKEAYIPEIEEMWNGAFHTEKRPNTKRFFQFSDGTDFRIHFSPTDDGEARAILPMLLSAKKGDEIRISMFGSGGIPYVRAIQWAAAKGANIKIVLDNLTSAGLWSWSKEKYANLTQKNPYQVAGVTPGKLEWTYSSWSEQNHMKIGTLTRGGVAQMIIVGSQNWSIQGNDENDENMITIRRIEGVPLAQAFNEEFDQVIWPAAIRDDKN